MVATTIVAILGSIYFVWYFLTYNTLIALRNAVEQTWSNIEVELNRRFDLINNLVAVVKGYTSYEKETLNEIVEKRKQASLSVDEAKQYQRKLQDTVTQLFMLAESYPNLKADSQYLKLQAELIETENRIAERRNAYNMSVNLYANKKMEFPSSLIAKGHNFIDKQFFDLPDERAAINPQVSLR